MTRRLLLLLSLFLSLSSFAQQRNAKYETYIDRYKNLAIEQMNKHKIPASITMAQGILESGAGTSELALKTNNHFGIKKGANWNGRVFEHPDDNKHDLFRVYDNVEQSYEDHSRILLRPRYQKLFSLKSSDYKGWARGLKECGYATDPSYADRLIVLIEKYELYKLDDKPKKKHGHDKNHENSYSNLSDNKSYENKNQFNSNSCTNAHHRIFASNNDIPCVIAMENDTWDSLSKDFGLKKRKLLQYNDATDQTVIYPGTFIYLSTKANKGPKSMKHKWHKVGYGDSMYSISQYYGIRLNKLYKLNFKSPDYTAVIGDLLRVR